MTLERPGRLARLTRPFGVCIREPIAGLREGETDDEQEGKAKSEDRHPAGQDPEFESDRTGQGRPLPRHQHQTRPAKLHLDGQTRTVE